METGEVSLVQLELDDDIIFRRFKGIKIIRDKHLLKTYRWLNTYR